MHAVYMILYGGDKSVVATNWAVVAASLHVAHRSLPEEKKHWVRERARHAARVAARRARRQNRDES